MFNVATAHFYIKLQKPPTFTFLLTFTKTIQFLKNQELQKEEGKVGISIFTICGWLHQLGSYNTNKMDKID